MELDLNTIINALIAIIGAGGVFGGGKYAYNRWVANRAIPERDGGFNPIVTGQIPTIVTSDQCTDIRKDLNDSMHEIRTEMKTGLDRQSGQLDKLSEIVTEIRTTLAAQEARVMHSVGFGVREHERRYHSVAQTGEYKKQGWK